MKHERKALSRDNFDESHFDGIGFAADRVSVSRTNANPGKPNAKRCW
jgi:hypothetical protein